MKDGFLNKDGDIIIKNAAIAIQQNKGLLSDLDGVIGDGDHGINMNKGFSMSLDIIQSQNTSLSNALMIVSNTLMNEIGGSMGPLYGVFFKKMAKVSANEELITRSVFQKMLNDATETMIVMGEAKQGDKTLVDTLTIARLRYNAAIEKNMPFDQALVECANGAEEGKESTRDMIAKIGRSARLGERSRGHLDAGATSCAIIITTMCRSMIALLQ